MIIFFFVLSALACVLGIVIVFAGISWLEPFETLGIWLAVCGFIATATIAILSSGKKSAKK